MNPSKQVEMSMNPLDCVVGDYPTLVQLKGAYGENLPLAWLMAQITNLSEYCGCKDKLEGSVLEDCSRIIYSSFHYLKVSELMLFFAWFKSGKYGRFYGNVDPMIITSALRTFISEHRNPMITEHENEVREKKRVADAAAAVTWEEYCKMTNKTGENPINIVNEWI